MKTTNEVNNLDTLPGEELPSINEKGSSSKRRAFAVLVVLGLFVVAVAIGFIKWRGYQKTVAGGEPKNVQLAPPLPLRTFAAPPSAAPSLPDGEKAKTATEASRQASQANLDARSPVTNSHYSMQFYIDPRSRDVLVIHRMSLADEKASFSPSWVGVLIGWGCFTVAFAMWSVISRGRAP